MIDLLFLFAAFVTAVIIAELVLGRTKIQTGLSKILVVHLICAAATLLFFEWKEKIGICPFILFWGGAFFSWFGIRSHVESSILLRMLYLLREQRLTAEDLLQAYESHYGGADRMEELFRGGLIERRGEHTILTKKGRWILAVASQLK